MPLYAIDEGELIYAQHAAEGKEYRCLECRLPVKVRKGRFRVPHFYHLRTSPSCRLYSKSEEHLIAQLDLQKLFPPGILSVERPFPKIGRVADACWEQEHLIFEIQCSQLSEKEAEKRIDDYASTGYRVVWLLDEKIFNKRRLRPAEKFLRKRWSYYFSLPRKEYYDQFETFSSEKRLKRGARLRIDPTRLYPFSPYAFSEMTPLQVLERGRHQTHFFRGDRIDRALKGAIFPHLAPLLERWRRWEEEAKNEIGEKVETKPPPLFKTADLFLRLFMG